MAKRQFKKVLKFGGSSVGDAARIKRACAIIRAARKEGDVVVVVSAMQGATDALLRDDGEWVRAQHEAAAKALRVQPAEELLVELDRVLESARVLGDLSPMVRDAVASFGERLSAHLVAAYLNKRTMPFRAEVVDARGMVITDDAFQNARVDTAKTNVRVRKVFAALSRRAIPIVTGFIASDARGRTTTLGRGGSDYTAAIFGAVLNVAVIEIWTDVNGIMSADPHVVPAARTLPEVSYEEAFEMAYFGAKVIYPSTMLPAVKRRIPILIKNTFAPRHPGTRIVRQPKAQQGYVKNISTIDGIGIITVNGTMLAGVPGMAERVFGAAARVRANIVLISQASSEQSICFAVNKNDVSRTFHALQSEFERERRGGLATVVAREGYSIIAVVGDNMKGTVGIAGRIFSALGEAGVNVAAIAQGASERNVSCIVHSSGREHAVRAIHRAFFKESRCKETLSTKKKK